jgi:hypothetical protein
MSMFKGVIERSGDATERSCAGTGKVIQGQNFSSAPSHYDYGVTLDLQCRDRAFQQGVAAQFGEGLVAAKAG